MSNYLTCSQPGQGIFRTGPPNLSENGRFWTATQRKSRARLERYKCVLALNIFGAQAGTSFPVCGFPVSCSRQAWRCGCRRSLAQALRRVRGVNGLGPDGRGRSRLPRRDDPHFFFQSMDYGITNGRFACFGLSALALDLALPTVWPSHARSYICTRCRLGGWCRGR